MNVSLLLVCNGERRTEKPINQKLGDRVEHNAEKDAGLTGVGIEGETDSRYEDTCTEEKEPTIDKDEDDEEACDGDRGQACMWLLGTDGLTACQAPRPPYTHLLQIIYPFCGRYSKPK